MYAASCISSTSIKVTAPNFAAIAACRFANYLAHCCSDYLAHYRSWRAFADPEKPFQGGNMPAYTFSPDLQVVMPNSEHRSVPHN